MSSTAPTATTDPPNLDRVFDLLAHRYRRWLVSYMVKCEKQTIPMTTAVNVITHFDPLTTRETAYQVLAHNHLRRLDLAGVIEYDREGGRITLVDNPLITQLTQDAMDWDPLFADED